MGFPRHAPPIAMVFSQDHDARSTAAMLLRLRRMQRIVTRLAATSEAVLRTTARSRLLGLLAMPVHFLLYVLLRVVNYDLRRRGWAVPPSKQSP